jgi:hypothetical protein
MAAADCLHKTRPDLELADSAAQWLRVPRAAQTIYAPCSGAERSLLASARRMVSRSIAQRRNCGVHQARA